LGNAPREQQSLETLGALQEGRNREVVAHHQNREHQGE
jgi:hypothetical protein